MKVMPNGFCLLIKNNKKGKQLQKRKRAGARNICLLFFLLGLKENEVFK